MDETELRKMLATLGDCANALHDADRDAKKDLYRRIGVKLKYAKNLHTVTVEIDPDAHDMEISSCPRGDLYPHTADLQLRDNHGENSINFRAR